ncbi:MAG: hypothetical protein AMJ81_12000 [Phycisphaerae bacterium SM23_33]|nr:MAG: hypothetical protein AMJ81_12000 [Phycisphaerae bacterium SM23_33]
MAILGATGAAAAQAVLGSLAETKPAEPQPEVIRLKAAPAAEPRPALTWLLLPEYLDQTPGNAAQLYYLAEQHVPSGKAAHEWEVKISEWLRTPLEKLPREQIRSATDHYSSALRQVELAARRERCLWDLPIRSEGYRLIIPAMSKYRTLARVLCLKARLHTADGRCDKAVHELQTGLAMARHFAAGPTLIHSLVGTAIASVLLEQVDTLIQAPGSPNLYWALTGLPRPFVSLRDSMECERSTLYLHFSQLRKPGPAGLTPQQWQAVMNGLWQLMAEEAPPAEADLRNLAVSVYMYPRAKRFLIAQGSKPAEVEAMPVQQVIGAYCLDVYEQNRDEIFKWFNVPYWQAGDGMERSAVVLQEATKRHKGNPFLALLPSLSRAYFLTTKLDRKIAALRCIEAVRMHAAAHGGQPPAELSEIQLVPIPADPITGKGFGYKVVGDTVMLEAPAPPGGSPDDELRYELTLTK